jgi:hypothetical protein
MKPPERAVRCRYAAAIGTAGTLRTQASRIAAIGGKEERSGGGEIDDNQTPADTRKDAHHSCRVSRYAAASSLCS